MVLDSEDNLIYYDTAQQKIYRVKHAESGWESPEILLDTSALTYSAKDYLDRTYTFKSMKVNQIFYDSISNCFLLNSTFTELDTSANDGWSSDDDPKSFSGTFLWENDKVSCISSSTEPIIGALTDGIYVVGTRTTRLWDSTSDTYSPMDSDDEYKYFIDVHQIGQELYGVSNMNLAWGDKSYHTNIFRYDFSRGEWEESAYMNSACAAYHDGIFYGWLLKGNIIALRPTGETKDIIDPQEDILVADFKTLPESPTSLLRTSDGTFIFYDENAKAIRAITPNPSYVEPDPTTELINSVNQLLVGTWKSEDGIYTMEASLGQAPGFYTIKITGGTSAQTATSITYDAELNTEEEIIKCFNGKRVDSSRFSEDIIYDGTGEAEIPYLSEDYLTFECHTAQDLEGLFEASVDFYKVTA